MLGDTDYRGILGVLEATGRTVTVGGFVDALIEGLERHLGYPASIFIVAEPSSEGPVASWGRMRGFPETTEEYFERWRAREPFEHPSARALIASRGVAELGDFYRRLGRPQREFCRDFLAPQGIRLELSAHIDTGLAHQGFLTLLGDKLASFEARDRARLMALRPHLANQLRGLLLREAPKPEPASGLATLSSRQLEAAELAARGLSNAEIAEVLAVTLPTVKKHLVAAYRTLGVSSRAQLAARWSELRGEPKAQFA